MDRLISSSLSSRAATPLRHHLARARPFHPFRSPSDLKFGPWSTRRRPLTVDASLISTRDGPPPGLTRPSSALIFRSQGESLGGGGELDRVSARKELCLVQDQNDGVLHNLLYYLMKLILVARSIVVALSVIVLAVLPILAQPSFATVQSAARPSGHLIRSELLSSAWTGFFAGCLHTLSGPDHLAALAPLSIGRTRIESAIVGALWGCGHDAGQVIFGLLFLLLKDRLHIEIIRTWGTRVVGLTLLVIGAMGIREASEVPTPCVALENGECLAEPLDISSPGKKKIGFATFATGIVHGLQPDALMMVLPALALPSRVAGAAFLCMFLVGTVFAMGSYTVFIGSCTEALKERVPKITEKLTWAASLVAISLGFAILISQLFGFSLY